MDETIGTINSQTYKRNRKTDVIIELKATEGVSLNSIGLIDKRLFEGDNKLHAIMDTQTTHWYLRYENGILPEPLKQRFTGWAPLFKFVKEYYGRRKIDIEVKD